MTKKTKLAPKPTKLPAVLPEIRQLIEVSRQHVVSTANLTLVWLYWNIGRVITQDVQKNQMRAGYGEQLLQRLAVDLTHDYGAGYSVSNLNDMRRFYDVFEILQPVSVESGTPTLQAKPAMSGSARVGRQAIKPPPGAPRAKILQTVSVESERLLIDFTRHRHLGWSHYRILLGQADALRRRFYFEQGASQRWSVRELRRQIERALFERVAHSRDTRSLIELERKSGPAETFRYEDIFKDPYLLDFLGLKGAYSEKDLESSIIANLQEFLIELGSDFCFIGRQYPMRIDDDDYFLDLLFYHRALRCLVAIDLKIGPFTAADKGQMDLYLAWLKMHEWRKGENEPVGLIMCTSKKRQHVELLLSGGPHKMRVSEYLTLLPDRAVLEERLKLYGRLLEEEPERR